MGHDWDTLRSWLSLDIHHLATPGKDAFLCFLEQGAILVVML